MSELDTAQDELVIATALFLCAVYILTAMGVPFLASHGHFLLRIYVAAFLVNFCWEVNHSVFYDTCLNTPLPRAVQLLLKASIGDGIWITILAAVGLLLFGPVQLLTNVSFLVYFAATAVITAYGMEWIALRRGFWQYHEMMAELCGVGVSPLFQIAITGYVSFALLQFL